MWQERPEGETPIPYDGLIFEGKIQLLQERWKEGREGRRGETNLLNQQTFSGRGQIINSLGFMGHMVSVTSPLICSTAQKQTDPEGNEWTRPCSNITLLMEHRDWNLSVFTCHEILLFFFFF